ncbi:hypothetical protein [Halobacterium zhouii]|nr:hypothetical protein [Halobacterium zhouii]
MALFNSVIGIAALLVGVALFVIVLVIVIDIYRWLRNPEANGGLQE